MYIVSTGMACPVGLNSLSACAAMRAGIANFEELPYVDNHGESIIGARVSALDYKLNREERLIELLSLALEDCLEHEKNLPIEHIPLIVGLSEPDRPGGGAKLSARIIHEMERKSEVRFHSKYSRTITQGHVSGFEGLKIARELMKDPNIPACIVCGVDSYINASSLSWLDEHWRLKTTGNSDGVIPGEAATSVLLQRQPVFGSGTDIKLAGLGFGYEKTTVLSEEPLLGLGLTNSASDALKEAGIQMNDVTYRLSDVTGESYGFREQALAIAKLLRVHREEGYPLWHCAEYIGDIGAAAGIIQLIVAFYACEKGYAPGGTAMCFTSAVSGRRAVAVLALNKSKTAET